MRRSILGALAGILVAIVIVFAVEAIGHQVYPPPPGIDLRDPEALRTIMQHLPMGGLLVVLAGWMLAAGIGAWTALRISRAGAPRPGVVVGAFLVAATIYNFWTIPHPVWFMIVAILGMIAATWVGVQTGRGSVGSR